MSAIGSSQSSGVVLTADELHFRMRVPNRETRIPLADVTAVETKR